MISQVLTRLVIGETVHHASQVTADVDETRVPYATAEATVPLDPATLASLDPRMSPRMILDLEVRYAGSDTAATLTALMGPTATAAAMSAAWAGAPASGLSAAHEHVWNAGPRQMPRRRRMNLTLRSRTIRRADGEVDVRATTDELLLSDAALVSTGPAVAGATLRDAARLAVGTASPGAVVVVDHSQGRAVTGVDARQWEPGVSAWEWVSPLLAAAGYRVWCDDSRIWHLAAADTVIAATSGALSTTQTVADITDTIDRDADQWADSVVVRYEWTDTAGVRQVRYDAAGSGSKTLTVRRTTPYPGAGEAAWLLWAAQRRARRAEVVAGFDPEMQAAMPTTLTTADGDLTGVSTGVRWSVPADTMTVTLRDLEDI